MKIYVNAITPEGIDLEDKLSASSLNLETEQIHYIDGVHVKAHAVKDKNILTVDCNIKSRKEQTCSRCLAEFDTPVEKETRFIYKLAGEHVVELNDNVRDTLILDYPMKVLCKQDCKGLCPHCGKNLNEGPCGCK